MGFGEFSPVSYMCVCVLFFFSLSFAQFMIFVLCFCRASHMDVSWPWVLLQVDEPHMVLPGASQCVGDIRWCKCTARAVAVPLMFLFIAVHGQKQCHEDDTVWRCGFSFALICIIKGYSETGNWILFARHVCLSCFFSCQATWMS